MERETLEENDYLRRQLEACRAQLKQPQQGAVLAEEDSPMLDPEIRDLDRQIERLTLELEQVLEETSAHQRAISFARAFIEEEHKQAAKETRAEALRDQLSLVRRSSAQLAAALDDAFGKGAAVLVLGRTAALDPAAPGDPLRASA